ncbi:hypothetical protein J2Z69_000085 [Paenibacillus shirakamiensis]|uniref:Uncharacterized protein n=1 Tax=Paenibacillus shirakamiensis TaxID=1265935 RepID=A0ABS4JD80_9BACL|nr:hypothetical protein [Paenibacillus shirakamiensis]MBP1999066.1 hypothetical protein [Paenibacillus shirakamiensis]
MNQFSVVRREIRAWLEQFKIYYILKPYELHLLFGGLGIMLLFIFLKFILPYTAYPSLDIFFIDLPLYELGRLAFWVGVWGSLVSSNVKYLPYALWIYALIGLLEYPNITLSTLVPAIVFAILGYALMQYTAKSGAREL